MKICNALKIVKVYVEYGILWYTVLACVLRAHNDIQYGVDVEKNYGCISEDNPWFLK